MDLDSVLKDIGEFGRFQRRAYFLINALGTPLIAQMLILILAGVYPQWVCLESNKIENCQPGKSCCTSDNLMCSGGEFTSSFFSIGMEWNLVCGEVYKNELAQSVFVFGKMFGCLLIGCLADRYGRKPVLHMTYVIGSAVALLSSFAGSFYVYAFFRFITGIFAGGAGIVSFVLCTEIIGPSMRGPTSTWSKAFYGLAFPVIAFLAYILQGWRLLTFFSVLPTLLIGFLHPMFTESPRWLASQGRTKEAEEVLTRIALENGARPVPTISLNEIIVSEFSVHKYGFQDIVKNKQTLKITAVLVICWSLVALVHDGSSFNVKNLRGNIYFNFALAGIVEMPSYLVTSIVISYSGRRRAFIYFLIGASLACFCCMALQNSSISVVYLTIAVLISKFFISAALAALIVYSAELYPTVVRNLALGVVSLASKFGGMLSPFVVLLGARVGEHNRSLPMFVFACASLVACLAVLNLHETLGKQMPETFQDLEKLAKNRPCEQFPPS